MKPQKMKSIFSFFFLLLGISSYAQEICNNGIDDDGDGRIDCVDLDCNCDECSGEQANFWYFANRAGIDFNSGSPVAVSNGQINTGEGCATMSDANGNLLFYTDGRTVWNRNHAIMTNGTGLLGHPSSTQSGVIVPHPGDRALYYVFTVDVSNGSNGLRYSIVDLSQSGGLGEVQAATKNTLLLSNTTEKIGVVKHCNNRDYWVIGHEYNNSNYYVYEVNTAGLNTTPNIQAIGTAHNGGIANKLGYLKPSADGKKLASAIFRKNTVDLFDFDNATGIISNPTILTTNLLSEAYGIEFSLDGQYLYATALGAPAKLIQFDVTAGNAATILSTGVVLAQSAARYEYGALQMGPDGRIYVARREVNGGQPQRTFISSINNPSVGGVGANFQDTAVVVTPGFSNLSLPTFVQSYFLPFNPQIVSQVIGLSDSLCTTTGLITYEVLYNLDECSLDTIIWTHSGVNTVTNITDTTLTIDAQLVGQDTIIAEVRTNCNAQFDTLIVNTSVCPEICDNGIDDDGDGLVDSYDEGDCPCNIISCDGPTFNVCSSCANPPSGPISNWAVNTLWQADFGSINASTLMPTVGDLDGDCLPEVVVVFRDTLYALDGVTGQVKYRNGDLDYASTSNGNLAIADVDRDGLGDVFIVTGPTNSATQSQRIARLEYDGATGFNLVYLSSTTVGPYPNYDVNNGQRVHFMTINLGDIDGNGSVEVVIGNQVFDANSGNLIASGGNTDAIGSAIAWGGGATNIGFISTASVLVDILPDAFCANCQGLELVAGNMIYSIDVATNTMTIEVTNNAIADGFTSVADLDFDGQLDVVTGWGTGARSEYTISAWNPLTGVSYDQFTLQNIGAIGLGRIAIADLDNAPTKDLELAFHLNPRLYTYKFNPTTRTFSTLAALAVSDPSRTSVTVFDFDGDGANEVIYRDETTLRILSGGTLTNVVAPLTCTSRTDFEYPVIVDANGDGQTEILASCGTGLTLYGNGQIGEQWVPSRKVWNQFSYFYTNINDDLTIPIQQQKQHLVKDSLLLNSFLKQYGNIDIPLPDASLQILSTTPILPDSVDMTIQICNVGDNTLPASTPITFYNADPTVSNASVVAAITTIGQNIEPSNCITQTYRALGTSSDVYAVVNCDNSIPPVFDFSTDFPMTTITECDYSNNMDNEVALLSADLLTFQAKKYNQKQAQLIWKLAIPTNYTEVEIERSADAQLFHPIATALPPQAQWHIDTKPMEGHNYYRLKMIHKDGMVTYSAIRQLYFEENEAQLKLLPNPFTEELTVLLDGTVGNIQSVRVVNVLGQVLLDRNYTENKTNEVVLNLGQLSAGTYWVQVQLNGKTLQRKVVKQ